MRTRNRIVLALILWASALAASGGNASAADTSASGGANSAMEARFQQLEDVIAQQQNEILALRDEVTADSRHDQAAFDLPDVASGILRDTSFHAFGNWGYGNTNHRNDYSVGETDGGYDNFSGGLNFIMRPHEKMRIQGQIEGHQDEVELEWLFAEWHFSDLLRARGGRSKHAMGIYGEIHDIGTLRPFFTLPTSVYGPNGLVGENYDGIGASGRVEIAPSWNVSYDVYGGQIHLEEESPLEALEEEEGEEGHGLTAKNLIGGRLVLDTPVEGLSVGSSAYWAQIKGHDGTRDHLVWGFQAEYLTEDISIRSEYYHHTENNELTSDSVYVEGAYRFLEKFQLAGRWEWANEDVEGSGGLPNSLTEHQEIALGLNYWFTPNLVVKTSYHHIWGNRFAFPGGEMLEAALDSGNLRRNTDMVVTGLQFAF